MRLYDYGPHIIQSPTHGAGLVKRHQVPYCIATHTHDWTDLYESGLTCLEVCHLPDDGMVQLAVWCTSRLGQGEVVLLLKTQELVQETDRKFDVVIDDQNEAVAAKV
jgi:hypothetical protein